MSSEESLIVTDDWPLVSVIVSVYNGGRFLAQALDSVFAQDYHPLEVIVVDDGSTDDTADVARSYPEVHYIYQENQGVAVARNTGIAAARGDLIALQDADDLWVPGKLTLQVGHLRAHPEFYGNFGMWINFADGAPPAEGSAAGPDRVGLVTLVVRREVHDRVGIYDPAYRVGSDMDWFSRARDAGANILMLPDILLHRRIHDGNLSRQMDARMTSMLRMFRASIERKRQELT
jgi:glycosyltransferase involved in cell wall biosynthesis